MGVASVGKGGGDFAESLLWEYSKPRPPRRGMRLTAGLTFLQFTFAMYATFLLYFMSPTLDVVTGPEISWASHITRRWRDFLWHNPPQVHLPQQQQQLLQLPADVCQVEKLEFQQKRSNDSRMIKLKTDLFQEIVDFQQAKYGRESLQELLLLPSSSNAHSTRVTVILNHFKRKTLCAQLDALLQQTLPVHRIWVLAFGSPNEDNLRRIVVSYNDSRIDFVGSSYDFKYYGRFQMALQADSSDFVYLLDDDMIPGRKMLQILSHIAGTDKYRNSVLGSIGRVLPFRQKDYTFPSYRKFGSKEAGIYIPDPAYGIVVDRMVKVDFLSSSWFLSYENVKALFVETPFTFSTGEDLHLSYQMQKYRGGGSYVVPTDPQDRETWGDSEHRLAYVSETTVIHKSVVEVRDEQWWRVMSRGYITQWAEMNPQSSDAFFYAHSLDQVSDMSSLIAKFRSTTGKKAFVVIAGGAHCPCDEASTILGWPSRVCRERRFKIFDLELGSIASSRWHSSETGEGFSGMFQEIYGGLRGLMKIHSPAIIITVADLAQDVREAVGLAARRSNVTHVGLPRPSISRALWMADLKTTALQQWNKMSIVISIITQNRPKSLKRLLDSITRAYYLGDEIHITFNMDNQVDAETLGMGGLIRAVSESWYPSHDHEYGLLLEDDIEVSPYFYIWMKYALLTYTYSNTGNVPSIPELGSIALYTPRLVEVVKERPRWNATEYFRAIHPNTPYLHQLPCSWGALFFPKHWIEFYRYMATRYTPDAKSNAVQIPKSRTNGWQASWKKFLIDLMYLRGYVSLYPNFPNQTSFSTNHMEPGAHISSSENKLDHKRADFTVPLVHDDFWRSLPAGKMPPTMKLPVVNLFNQASSIRGLKAAGAKLRQDVLECEVTEVVAVDHVTGEPLSCTKF